MTDRKRLIQATTVLLYMGPLLAGLAGLGAAYLPPFVAFFMLCLVMLRPHKWPQRFGEWLTLGAGLAALTLLCSQTLFVALLFGVGRGIGGVLGFVPLFNPLLPVALSLVALPLLRLAWGPELALVTGKTIDQLLWTDEADAGPPRPVPASAEAALSDLFALAEDGETEVGVMLEQLEHFLDTGDIWSRLAALTAALNDGPANQHLALRTAVIVKATEPFPDADYTVPGEMRMIFAAAGCSEELLSLLSLRGRALLHRIPAMAPYFPPAGVVRDLAGGCEGSAAARALRDLAAALAAAGAPAQSSGQASETARSRPAAARPVTPGFVQTVAGARQA
ncbi:hypothetical protein [Rhodobacter sp. 24-YEA-8]|uniref:hypothetical protein n=1 Tax=Rhodobacter sp. 24-YEA-8 TaxID=1884310 RepID=UPI00115FE927|nr:hypothetical protein [Rhodobacter sp. 24-YEA-8]